MGNKDDVEKNYQELPAYKGNRKKCTHCKRKFEAGEVVLVSKSNNEEKVFCYSVSKGGCMISHTFKTTKKTIAHPHRMPGFAPPAKRIPNYPNIPI